MKYIKQFLMIVGISLVGELLKYLLPFPIPASIYGMVLLFVGLMTGIIKLESVKETGKFLIEIMPVMFIPAGAGLLTSWDTLSRILVPISLITVVTIITVMAATGWVSQIMIRKSGEKKDE
ncbi:MAG: CidA/LrgA family protein [Acetatifactor sp.]